MLRRSSDHKHHISCEYYKGSKICITHDDDLLDPMIEFDLLGHFVTAHKRYELGHKFFRSRETCDEYLCTLSFVAGIKIFMLDHGGLSVSHKPFGCPWDSGMLGWAVALTADVKKRFPKRKITDKLRAEVTKILEDEIKLYNQYLTGDVYCYHIENEDGSYEDSLCGIYGLDTAIKWAREAIDYREIQPILEMYREVESYF